jgi:hypothetical protein
VDGSPILGLDEPHDGLAEQLFRAARTKELTAASAARSRTRRFKMTPAQMLE